MSGAEPEASGTPASVPPSLPASLPESAPASGGGGGGCGVLIVTLVNTAVARVLPAWPVTPMPTRTVSGSARVVAVPTWVQALPSAE